MFPALRPFLVLLLASGLCAAEDFQGSTQPLEYDQEPIRYEATPTRDAVAQLQESLTRGEVKLPWDETYGYLPAVLAALKVPVSSQTLVFSKTSLQRHEIGPRNPRALYFNENVYVGYIPGAPHLEIASADPELGGIFYTLDQEKVRQPKFARETDCLRCHGGQRSLGVPGPIMRSIGTDSTGELESQTEVTEIDHCAPLADRWAGWYVTGQHGSQTHRGNLIGLKALQRQEKEPNFAGDLEDLSAFFDTSKYLNSSSDIAALMLLAHQTHMHNYLTRLRFDTEIMMYRYGHIRYLHHQEDAFLRYLLFTEEAPLREPIVGSAAFREAFAAGALRDRQGRSLRDLDFQTRMFRYPCSYLIYTEAFDHLPEMMREHLLGRLYDILTGKDADPQFAKLSAPDRRAVLEILRDTKPNLPAYWYEG